MYNGVLFWPLVMCEIMGMKYVLYFFHFKAETHLLHRVRGAHQKWASWCERVCGGLLFISIRSRKLDS